MIDHEARARELFAMGYNCAQAVFAAFCEDMGMDMTTALKLASSFGGGLGRMREVCGAVSGMAMAAGMLYGYDDPEDQQAKSIHYGRVQQMALQFKEANGSVVCRELLGLSAGENGPAHGEKPCGELVAMAARLLDAYIRENEL